MIYFDNAATTCPDPEVVRVMEETLRRTYGNPSSVHALGREARVLIEESRKLIASHLNVSPSSIYFTSCGTEALNTVLLQGVPSLKIENIITTDIEHHAVLHSIRLLEESGLAKIHKVRLQEDGHIDLIHLEELLQKLPASMVCLMHANNEIGTLLPLERVRDLCKKHKALLLVDTVQSLGKYHLDFKEAGMDFAACSAHKFHGPKGAGFLYVREGLNIPPLLHGGGQERNMRSGTENISGIVGMAKALDIALSNLEAIHEKVEGLRNHFVDGLKQIFPAVKFNNVLNETGIYNLANVSFPVPPFNTMLLQRLDMEGICASGGSACNSGALSLSTVLQAIGCDPNRPNIRFSFSKFNNVDEVDQLLKILQSIASEKNKG